MKKMTFFVVFMGLACICFAKGRRDSIELGIASPYVIENSSVSGVDIKTKMSTLAINFSGISLFTDNVGMGVYANFIFPLKLTTSTMGYSISVNRSAYDMLFGIDMLLGPVFIVYKNNKFVLPFSAGIHCMLLRSVAHTMSSIGTSLGVGVNITGEYHFNNRIYLLGRFQLTFDCYSINSIEQDVGGYSVKRTYSGMLKTWGINPIVGIGIKF
jgi:hypothetical protein